MLLLLIIFFWVCKNRDLRKKKKKRVLIMGLNFASLFTSIPCEPSCYWHCSSISSHAMVENNLLMIFGCKIRILKLTTNWVKCWAQPKNFQFSTIFRARGGKMKMKKKTPSKVKKSPDSYTWFSLRSQKYRRMINDLHFDFWFISRFG